MKRALTLYLFVFSVTASVQAQYWSLSLTGGAGIPVGEFGTVSKLDATGTISPNITGAAATGFGFGFRARCHFYDHWAAGVDLAYYRFPGKPFPNYVSGITSGPNQGGFDAAPLLLGVDYYFTEPADVFRPYISLEAGYIGTSLQWETSSDNTLSAASSSLLVAPGAGLFYQVSNTFGLIANIKYHHGLTGHKFNMNDYLTSGSEIGLPPTQFFSMSLGINFVFDTDAKPY